MYNVCENIFPSPVIIDSWFIITFECIPEAFDSASPATCRGFLTFPLVVAQSLAFPASSQISFSDETLFPHQNQGF